MIREFWFFEERRGGGGFLALGAFLVAMGLLILAMPEILVALVSGVVIAAGVLCLRIGWASRRERSRRPARWDRFSP